MGNKVGALRKLSACTSSEYDLAGRYGKNRGGKKTKCGDGSIECEVHIFNHPPSPAPTTPNLSPYSWNNNSLPSNFNSYYQNQQTIFDDETDMLSKIGILLSSADLNKRMQENLQAQDDPLTLSVAQGDLFCAKYEYNPTQTSMHSMLNENEQILNLTQNEFCFLLDQHSADRNWVKIVNKKNRFGWVPASYLLPVKEVTESVNWYHGLLSKNGAEVILSNGVNGSFLVRESESSPGKVTLSMHFDVKIYHYRILIDHAGKYHINMDKAFNSIYDLVQYHTTSSDGLISKLIFPVPSQGACTQSPIQGQQLLCSSFTYSMLRNSLAESIVHNSNKFKEIYSTATPEMALRHENLSEKVSTSTDNSTSEHRYENYDEAIRNYKSQLSYPPEQTPDSNEAKIITSNPKIATL
ncbi:uncharacterized protein LOC142343585 [Convolutriloba macropyga]|uniref:uncharacterized protein LOC142343585 n=1 Tax=Convolutriloba macropyga TaxID=536237 RepID=UPI003F52512D